MSVAAVLEPKSTKDPRGFPIRPPSDHPLSPQLRTFFRRKYRVDRLLGTISLIVLSPLILTLWVLVRLTSRGPGFYRQVRVGLDGDEFRIVKLRTMVVNAERPGETIWCAAKDPRVTWFGKFLRSTHLDELPQLWNVARGEMVFVGPRPERPKICRSLAQKIDRYYDRVVVKPGLTGMAQINLPADRDIEDVWRKQTLDLHYIRTACLGLDFRILVATAFKMVGMKGPKLLAMLRLCREHLLNEQARALLLFSYR